MTSKVITIGRQFGSGGHQVGLRLASKLGIPFYDKEILSITASNSKFAEEYLEKMDEQKPGFLSMGTASAVTSGALSGKAGSIMGAYYTLSPNDQIFLAMSKVLHDLAQKPCVIVGRASDYVLRDIGSINIFLHAPIEDRINRKLALEENSGYTHESMEKLISTTDRNRRKYYEYYTHQPWGDADHYDICIDTGSTGIDGTVSVICCFLEEFHKKSILPD